MVAILMGLIGLGAAPAHAVGFGLFGNFDGGKMVWEGYGAEFMNYGGGFVLDTNLAMDSVFNYRLELGFSNLRTPYEVKEMDFAKTFLFINILNLPYRQDKTVTHYENSLLMSTVHYFGFGVVRTKNVRFWLGPQLTIAGMLTNLTGLIAGLGFAMGLNINIGDVFTLSFVGSGRYIGGVRVYTYNGTHYTAGGYGGDGLITMAFIFRVPSDNFKGRR